MLVRIFPTFQTQLMISALGKSKQQRFRLRRTVCTPALGVEETINVIVCSYGLILMVTIGFDIRNVMKYLPYCTCFVVEHTNMNEIHCLIDADLKENIDATQ